MICSDVGGRDKLAEMYGMLQTLCGIGVTCGTPFSGESHQKQSIQLFENKLKIREIHENHKFRGMNFR